MKNAIGNFKTLKNTTLKGKKVLLRVDLNSAVFNGGVKESERYAPHASTIKTLLKKGAKVIVLSHQGRPGDEDFISLEQHSKLLNNYAKVRFVKDILGNEALKEIKSLKNGEAILLDNIRFLKEEFNPSPHNKLAKFFAANADLYVQDAFSIVHRDQTSITSLAENMPSCIGPVFENEIKAFSKVMAPKKPIAYVLGGFKIADYLSLIEKASKEGADILSCGVLGLLTLRRKGQVLGHSEVVLQKKGLFKEYEKISPLISMLNPVDFAADIGGKRVEFGLDDLPNKYYLADIGPETVKAYSKYLRKAKTIFVKGTAGCAEDPKFMKGTELLLKEVAKNKKAFKLLGGGHLTTAMKDLKIDPKKFSYVSLSGGALVKYLSGERLPGLESLKRKKR